ncbi:hypothetical protein FAGAP_4856 [Fusarium agapanthi]|uniref:Uncharacterized protein n=1 Tax=Fusarium agapanthi TaxID=1803897 RepID=A0A9P5E7F6_9HYPO|nr:hypothetical protein FAGAP_4856 [Fusarium agapanthi]
MPLPLTARTLDTIAPRSFVSLPCELRHMIYKYYFTTEQGYHFSAASRKLTAVHGEPVDIALLCTCRLIAEETKEISSTDATSPGVSLHHYPNLMKWGAQVWRWQGMDFDKFVGDQQTSFAISFLDALPLNKRSSLRNIIIHEDRASAGYSDGHAIGLIPFCQENRGLRIRHKFSMVRNLLERAYLSRYHTFDDIQDEKDELSAEVMFRLAAEDLYPIVANCLAEAMFLPDAGMPDGSYTLLLDAEDATDMCSAIFQQDVLGKDAIQLVLARALKVDPDSDWANSPVHDIRSALNPHAGALKYLVNKTSFLESNFYPGHLHNVDALMEHYKRVGMGQCVSELLLGQSVYRYDFTSFSHVPKFDPMLLENFECRKLPESFSRPMTIKGKTGT